MMRRSERKEPSLRERTMCDCFERCAAQADSHLQSVAERMGGVLASYRGPSPKPRPLGGDIYLVSFETVNGFDLSGGGRSFKPAGRTPRVLIRHRHEAVFHRVLMHVIQPRQIRLFISQPRLAVVVPDFAGRGGVEPVDPVGGLLVQESKHPGQVFCRVFISRRVADEMVVVGENGPGFRLPAKIRSDFEQASMQYCQPGSALEIMLMQIGARADKVSSANAETMLWCAWPRDFVCGYEVKVANLDCDGKRSATPLSGVR
jgi:hypothetical protein